MLESRDAKIKEHATLSISLINVILISIMLSVPGPMITGAESKHVRLRHLHIQHMTYAINT